MIRLLHIFGLSTALLFLHLNAFGQCSNCVEQWPTGPQSTTSNTLVNVASCVYGGEYAVYTVTAGETYTWTTCAASNFDTQLTLYESASCGSGTMGAYNDDDCGLQSTITWTATSTGQVTVLLSQYNCSSNSTCQTVEWACLSCGSSGACVPAPYSESDPCYQAVITADPFCCESEWDMFCEEDYAVCNDGGSGGTITTCNASFYDSGGLNGDYSNNELTTTTYCPSTPDECIVVSFNSFSIENNWDYLDVYDGPNTASPLIGSYTGTNSPGVIQADNPSGCLTFVFDSDGSITYPGWQASVFCNDCDDLPPDPPAPPEDCGGASTICSDDNFSGNSSGPGVQELNVSNSGCLSTENQSSWFYFSPQSTGTIAFMLTPDPMQDYDFAIWGPYDEPSCPPSEPPIRCSWSAAQVSTGLQAGAGDVSEGAGGDGVVDPITVGPGEIGMVYILMIDNWSGSSTPFDFTWNQGGGLSLDCTPLPVELMTFEGRRVNEKNELYWTTASETNADHFAIERSYDGSHYETIGIVPASGNSSTLIDYSFMDDNPGNRQTYYLLKQVDFNGAHEYFGPVAIARGGSGIEVRPPWPNPVTEGLVNLEVDLPHNMTLKTRVVDPTGRTVYRGQQEYDRGIHQLQIDLSGFSPGIYEIQLTDEEGHLQNTSRIVR